MSDFANSAAYLVRRARLEVDRQAIVSIWRGNLGDPARADHKFDWFYVRSQTGQPLTFVLEWSGGETGGTADIVGVAAAGRRQFQLDDQPITAGVLVDMAVVPQHRSLYPALLLQKTLLEAGMESFPVLYGFPNPKAAAVFHRAGYRMVGKMVRYVRVVRSKRYLVKWLPRWAAAPVGAVLDRLMLVRRVFGTSDSGRFRLDWHDAVPPATESLSSAPVEGGILHGCRTDEFLAWRFANDAQRQYGRISVLIDEESEEIGYWVTEAVDEVLYLRDCSASLLEGPRCKAVWSQLFREARRGKFSSVSFECLAPESFRNTLEECGMQIRGDRPVFGIVCEATLSSPANFKWYLTAADEDE